jgi:predicted DNA-binding transcriptional regulator AlpA
MSDNIRMAMQKAFLNEIELSELLSISLAAIRKWRTERRGPPYLKLGACVRYRLADVEAWLASRPVRGERLVRHDEVSSEMIRG